MNHITLLGRLTTNPKVEKRKKGDVEFLVVNAGIAVDRGYNKNGNNETDFINLVVFGKNAENFANCLVSGSLVLIEGSLRVESYLNKEGKKSYSHKVVVSKFRDLDFRKSNQSKKDGIALASGIQSEQKPLINPEPTFDPGSNSDPTGFQGSDPTVFQGLDPQGFQAIDDDDIPF